jgi:hypothetical protein
MQTETIAEHRVLPGLHGRGKQSETRDTYKMENSHA